MDIIPVVMAGGSGSRLWPLSRKHYPKQFLPLMGEKSLFQEACLRAKAVTAKPPVVICNEVHRFVVAEQLRLIEIDDATIILEPAARNTAPAVALAAEHVQRQSEDALLLVLSADHHIPQTALFSNTVIKAVERAESNKLITLGIQPTSPETGYGYIKRGKKQADAVFTIASFVEKPAPETAQQYLNSGDYLWNSGMFIFKASLYLEELSIFAKEMSSAVNTAMASFNTDMGFIRPDEASFLKSPDDSIDYAIMEHTQRAEVVIFDGEWSDLGAWSSLWNVNKKDEHGNVAVGEVISVQSQSNYIHSEEKLTAVLGLENIVIVDTKDALLVSHKDCVQDIKQIVGKIKKMHPSLVEDHRHVQRPWGMYDSIDSGQRYQVKRITVKPGAKLSLQMHHHRAEHWIVVSGSAKVTIGENLQLVAENQSVYIPIGEVHCLENPGKIPLELIEVQSGSYLGEDDIVRFEDKYGRN